jgi:amino acid adenylation domain-containing protein
VANAAYSGVQVQRDMARVREGERTFAPVVFACNLGTPLINAECRETLGKLSYMISQTPQVWIDFQVYEMDDGLLLVWDAVDALFPDGLIDQMFTAYTQFIEWLVADNNDWQSSLNVLSAAQQQIRDTDVELSIPQSTQCLHTSFFDFAATNPQQIALIDSHSNTHLTCGEVAKYALQVAALLKEHGVMQGDPVAVTLPRGTEQIAAVFGIVALGACYVPISVEQPSVRRDRIHKKAAIRHVLTNHEQAQTIDWPIDAIVLDIANTANTTALAEPVEVSPEQLAYIIFTSGSTGEPKGVEISHCAAWNTIAEINRRYNVSATDRILAVSSLDFDLSVYDIFGLLSVGGSLVLITEDTRRDAAHWLKLLNKYQVTIWNSVPVLLDMLMVVAESEQQKNLLLRLVQLSGDWIGLDLPARLHSVAEHCHLVAMGGATEASIWSNFFDVTLPLPAHWTSIPYGRPLANQAYRVVDSQGRDCPDWVAGELWIGGAGVAQGYRGDPKLTAECFVKWNGSRWYRTGDLGRYLPDGNIEFLGREDFQVKIRGHRIELGEIEAILKQHPGMHDAVVTAAGDPRGSKHLVGYVVLDQGRAVNIHEAESSQNDDIAGGYEQFGQDGAVLLDPVKRLEFKRKKPGVREKDTDSQYIKFAKPEMDDALINIYSQRLSYRKFEKEQIKLEQFWGFLRHLSAIEFPELPFPRYRYGSAGGLYPVQVYLYIKPDRVGRLSEGIYYYNPIDNHLVVISAGAHIDRSIVTGGNADIFDEAAFAIFFIADLDAISPMYGGRSRDFCMIEAGLMTQLLETSCFAHQIGLCQIGALDFSKIRQMFGLKESHEYLHCLFSGRVNQPEGWSFLHEASQSMLTASKKSKSGIGIIDELGSFLKQKLPDYMVPSSLIVLDKLPLSPNGKVDRQALPAPEDVGSERKRIFVAPRTSTEVSLADIYRQVLKIEHIGIHDNFFELGGDSLLAVQLVSRVRQTLRVELPLGRLFETPNIAELAEFIEKELRGENSLVALPEIVPDPEQRHLPFPLTDIQQAYWIGRSGDFELGNIATHFYIEIESDHLNIERLNLAWQRVIDRHEMLRAVVLPDGQQKILDQVPPYQFDVMDLRKQNQKVVEAELSAIRQKMSHQILPADRWPLFDIRASQFGDSRVRLHISCDALIADAWSFFSFVSDWYEFYQDPHTKLTPLDISFRDYVLAEADLQDSELCLRDKEYWFNRLPSLPPSPELPLARDPGSIKQPRFNRRSFTLVTEVWQKLKSQATQNGLTPSGLLIAAYADVLSVWSKSPRFTINLTLFNRLPLHPQVNNIIGDFTSLTLLAVDNSGEERFITRASKLQQQLWQDLDHRYFSGIRVLREIARLRGEFKRSAMPVVFTSALNMESLGRDVSGFNKLGEWVYGISQTPQVWLDHQVYEQDGDLILIWDAVEELFPEGLLDDMFEAYCHLFERLADKEKAWQETTPPLIPAAQSEKRAEVNATDAPVSSEMLHTLFGNQVLQQPDQLAVVSSNRTLSYEELSHRSNQIGRLLRDKGAQPNALVAVVMEKGWEQVVGALGILNSGAAYLPIDPTLPKKRFWHLLEDGKVGLVLTQSRLDGKLEWPEGIQHFSLDKMELTDKNITPLEPVQRPEDLAYVIYTSGSTGLPKGVMIDHRGAVNTILDVNKRFGVGPEDKVLALSNLNFDLSVYDIFGTLAAGGTIVLPEATGTKDPPHWLELMTQENVTVWNSVPALMQMLVEYPSGRTEVVPQSLRLVLLSGDWIPLDLPDKIKAMKDGVQVISLGGATEASIWSNLYPVKEVEPDWKSIPYGRPIVNQRFYVLNEFMEDSPDWVPGQLYIGGIGLAQGYWQDEEKTKASFIIHPRTGERLYRTGDLGRYLPDGNIEFLGREDFQVKIRGYRIELGEIEAALKTSPEVQDAVVITEGEPPSLAAAVVLHADSSKTENEIGEELRAFLATQLPGYMVPNKIVVLNVLPLNANGKVDRTAIGQSLKQRQMTSISEISEPPRDALERQIARIWTDILQIQKLSRNDDFFLHGGDSLKATRIIGRLRTQEIAPRGISLRTLFAAPTVATLAEQIRIQRSKQGTEQEPQYQNFEEGTL